jgi:hypothetical protein
MESTRILRAALGSNAAIRRPLGSSPAVQLDAGDLATTHAMSLLYGLAADRRTGKLALSIGAIEVTLVLRDGNPVSITSNVATDRFENYLVKRRLIRSDEIALILAVADVGDGSVAEAAVKLGLLRADVANAHLVEHMKTKIADVCSWKKGTFSWSDTAVPPQRPLVGMFELLGAAAAVIDERVITSWLTTKREMKLTGRAGAELDAMGVAGIHRVLREFDGKRTVGELADSIRDHTVRMRWLRLSHLLERCGFLA